MLRCTELTHSVDMINLDFSKAFGKGDHVFLLHKLIDMGTAGTLWFHSILSNCYHFVGLADGSSIASPIISEVPHGSVLGPQLFLIPMFDIDNLNGKIVCFGEPNPSQFPNLHQKRSL